MKKDNLSLYKLCQECGVKCCIEPGPPIVFTEEIDKIKIYLNTHNLENNIIKVKGEGFYIIPRDENGCPYLKDGSCEIQEVKPLDCRKYPLGLDKELNIGVSVSCPVKNKLPNDFITEALKLINNLTNQQKTDLARFHSSNYVTEPLK